MVVRNLLATATIFSLLAVPVTAEEAIVTYKSMSPELALDLGQRRFDGAPLFIGFHAGHVLTFLDGGKNSARSARL